jgi:5-enolpyruvylshikimate-3-phosphate synthase
VASGETTVADYESAAVSYPGFWETLRGIENGER